MASATATAIALPSVIAVSNEDAIEALKPMLGASPTQFERLASKGILDTGRYMEVFSRALPQLPPGRWVHAQSLPTSGATIVGALYVCQNEACAEPLRVWCKTCKFGLAGCAVCKAKTAPLVLLVQEDMPTKDELDSEEDGGSDSA